MLWADLEKRLIRLGVDSFEGTGLARVSSASADLRASTNTRKYNEDNKYKTHDKQADVKCFMECLCVRRHA